MCYYMLLYATRYYYLLLCTFEIIEKCNSQARQLSNFNHTSNQCSQSDSNLTHQHLPMLGLIGGVRANIYTSVDPCISMHGAKQCRVQWLRAQCNRDQLLRTAISNSTLEKPL